MNRSAKQMRLCALLVAGATASCLSDAIPPGDRQNLVNMNGESYPIGFFISNYAASYAANILASKLVAEVLGFNTTLNLNSLGSGTVAGYYGVTGCRTPNNVADRGCLQGVTYYHVHMESWLGIYPADWEYIQRTYSSMAPKDLGTMGYNGLSSMYIPKPVQTKGYATDGTALQYYKDWNPQWNQPWNFFSSIDSVNTSWLAPCNRSTSVMSNDAMLRRHVQYTGDADGVVIVNDTYSARCDDGFFWTAPTCRNDTTKCIAYITGGQGWGTEEFMQKFTIFNMPVAIAVAYAWGDYTRLPLSANMSFYWWSPDPTFLELSPLNVKFPPHKSREFAQNVLTSEASAAVISSLVSPDLAVLAPIVETFIDKLSLPMIEMDQILLDQKSTGDTWDNVTCRWMQANRAMWQRWIPDESECFGGFGLYDSVMQQFVSERVNAINKIVCQACDPGSFSQKLKDDSGETYVCIPCAAGSSQPSGATQSCVPCKAGEYQNEVGSTTCKRCDFGAYQDQSGQTICKTCPQSTSTLGLGSVAENECGCEADFIDINVTGAFECVKCGEGMLCPALSQVVDLRGGRSSNGDQFTPKILPGFYSTWDQPTEIFRCTPTASCPGGTPESCASGLEGHPCSSCAEGFTWTGSQCEECAGWRQALWVMAFIGVLVFMILAYHFTTNKVVAKTTVLFATTASFGMLVTSMQNMGLVGMITVEWPMSISTPLNVCKFLLLDIDNLGFACVAGQQDVTRYVLNAMLFPFGLAWLGICYVASQLLPQKYQWQYPYLFSVMGGFLQVGFNTMSALSLAPMMCYLHPNGQRSVLKYPGVICGSSDHEAMLLAGWILLMVFVLGFFVLCCFLALKVPQWSIQGKDRLVVASRFLFFRFRLDTWWFGVPLLLRGPLISLPVVWATDDPPVQIVVIAMLLTTNLVLQLLAWPWKVPLLNAIDAIVSFCLVLLTVDASMYITTENVSSLQSMYAFGASITTTMLAGIGGSVGVMLLMAMTSVLDRAALGGSKENIFFTLGKVPSARMLAGKIKDLAKELESIDTETLEFELDRLPVYDLRMVTTCITLLATEVACPEEDEATFMFSSRISSFAFDPNARKSRQSRRTISAANRNFGSMAIQSAEREEEEEEMSENEVHVDPLRSTWM